MNKVEGKVICSGLGGSHAYGLNGPQSDLDERGVFVSNNLGYILGVDAGDKGAKHVDRRNDKEDVFYFEFRHFLSQLRKSGSQALELLFHENLETITEEWVQVIDNREQLLDSHAAFKSLRGYCQGERRLMSGERTGQLGGKRRGHLEQYGYSYKNAVQILRICYSGARFFETGIFPVNLKGHPPFDQLWDIKNHPEKYNLADVTALVDVAEVELVEAYDNIQVCYEYDEEVANLLCLTVYSDQFPT